MKTQMSLFTALLIAGIALFTNTASTPGDRMIVRINKVEATKTIQVQLANLQKQRTQVAIQNVEGTLWFSEFVTKEDGYAKKLNLAGMPDGQYLCFVSNKKGQVVQSFRLDGESVVFAEQRRPGSADVLVQTGSTARPAIVRIGNGAGNNIRLQMANLQQQDVLVRLNVLGAGIAFEQKVCGKQGCATQLNLDGLAAGPYFLNVRVGAGSLVQHINLNGSGIQMGALECLEPAPAKGGEMAHN